MTIPEFYSQPPPSPGRTAVEPYGFLGLIFSLAGICLLGGLIMAGLLGAASGIWVYFEGAQPLQAAMGELSARDILEVRSASWPTQMAFYVMLAASFLGFGLAVLAFARLRGGAQWRDPIAWHAPAGWPAGKGLWLLAGAALAYLFVAGFAIKLIYPSFRSWFFAPAGATGIALSLVTVVLLAPWAEELFFRGWIYSSLRRSFGWKAAVAVVALVFALVHLDATRLYPVPDLPARADADAAA